MSCVKINFISSSQIPIKNRFSSFLSDQKHKKNQKEGTFFHSCFLTAERLSDRFAGGFIKVSKDVRQWIIMRSVSTFKRVKSQFSSQDSNIITVQFDSGNRETAPSCGDMEYYSEPTTLSVTLLTAFKLQFCYGSELEGGSVRCGVKKILKKEE